MVNTVPLTEGPGAEYREGNEACVHFPLPLRLVCGVASCLQAPTAMNPSINGLQPGIVS